MPVTRTEVAAGRAAGAKPVRTPVRWLSARSVLFHVGVVLAVPLCLFAGWWQATRAMSGNTLSYFYAIEWPGFAGLSIFVWWQLLHTEPAGRRSEDEVGPGPALESRPLRWDRTLESAELQSYNRYLAELATLAPGNNRWRTSRWRRPGKDAPRTS